MNKNLDSKSLFLAQIKNHSEELGKLLMVGVQDTIDAHLLERAIVSTNMLAGSSSLMNLNGWQVVLNVFGDVLATYRDKGLLWEERIAQSTSEIIERAEGITTLIESQPDADPGEAFSDDESQSLVSELEELKSFAESSSPPEPEAEPLPQESPADSGSTEAAGDDVITGETAMIDPALGASPNALSRHVLDFVNHWHIRGWDFTDETPQDLEQIRRELFLIHFYALSVEQFIARKAVDRTVITIGSLVPVQSAIEDFATAICAGTDRTVEISFVGERHALDARLLFPAQKSLQCMISDIFLRCEEKELKIEVTVEERFGSLMWSLSDNGENFIADSHLDREEHLAFYPSLREICKSLVIFRSLLFVEPTHTEVARFCFTLPVSPDGGPFVMWNADEQPFAVLSNQVAAVIPKDSPDVGSDEIGEYVTMNGHRIPVVKLKEIYKKGPSCGDMIAVIGCLEKRVAFYVPDEGEMRYGRWLREAIPAWKGTGHGVAKIDDKNTPLVEATSLLSQYVTKMTAEYSAARNKRVSGGGIEHDNDLSQAQAEIESEVTSPPDISVSSPARGRVLVVEKSESLRSTLAAIFEENSVEAVIVDELDAAVKCLDESPPAVIISEFRVPSRAAKVLVEKLKAEGKEVPVLVTTIHQGEDADLLVSKLGVAGYISKPLNPDDVMSCVEGFIDQGAPSTG